eukprot:TRINITY_DN873_c0_g1_i1.p1 TRINITY_DN873_c0_g1~~TRINITY_DN873_c0_g1_i1.p1  ORF type:complete len:418 (+),score=31.95 TRINITY_DN873_c0_g1_i1:2434-3687(+)
MKVINKCGYCLRIYYTYQLVMTSVSLWNMLILLLLLYYTIAQSCLHKKDLVKVDVVAAEIIKNHNTVCDESTKNFANTLLGYVTPWNPEGKKLAKTYASKLDIISPVWHNIDLIQGQYRVTGEENYDSEFIDEIKEKNPNIKVVPRFNIEKGAIGRYYQLGGEAEAQRIAELVTKYAMQVQNTSQNYRERKYDGMVLETGIYFHHQSIKGLMSTLVKAVGEALHDKEMMLIITVFLKRDKENPLPDLEPYNELSEVVDYLNVMVYDFIQDGTHAPLHWGINTLDQIESGSNIPPSKILIGVPFYGYKFFGKEPVPAMGTDFVKFLQGKNTPLFQWNKDSQEHSAIVREYVGKSLETKVLLYPTLYVFCDTEKYQFFEKRLDMCKERGCGIAIWELGQGLTYFLSMFQYMFKYLQQHT